MKRIELNEKWSIEKQGNNYTLIELYESEGREKGKPTGKTIIGEHHRYYGTLYQALNGFVDHSADMEDIPGSVAEAMKCIESAKAKIKDEYRIVKVVAQ